MQTTVDADLGKIEEIENTWIAMSDGVRLAARVWLPKGARGAPAPAVLEYLPYRKRDFMRARDEPIHRYFAMAGYASLRVDVRGSGDSDGILRDEYSEEEIRDALEVIAWIARQPWCDGAVGMMGISWGGFNALQVAAKRPPALRAVISLCAADDRYADDAHYMGGCLLNENMQWGSILTMNAAYPPDPEIVGERWRAMWRRRIEALEPFPALWMRHPWRDDYWKHGSVCEDFSAIACAVYAIGGWADGYSNAVPRLLAGLTCPTKGLIGPWAHTFPHDGVPGPAIGFLQEAVRWWDHWLRGRDTGIMDEPAFRVWMQESVAPKPFYEERPGRWVAEPGWPSPSLEPLRLSLNVGHLSPEAEPAAEIGFSSPEITGLRAGEWCAFGADGEMPLDQRPDDGGSLTFDSDPLPDRLEILGAPVVTVDIRVDRPVAMLAARLCDVAPDGTSLRVTYGLLNLCQRESREAPAPLEPGRWYRIAIPLNDIAHAFLPGHRLRLGLSTNYWPLAWPSPAPVVATIRTGTGTLDLLRRRPRPEDDALRAFEPPAAGPSEGHRKIRRMPMRRTIQTDLVGNETIYTLSGDGGEFGGASLARLEEIDLDLGYTLLKRYRIREGDPLSAETELVQRTLFRRAGWVARLELRTRLSASADSFRFVCDLETFEGEEPFAQRSWTISVPRKLV